MCQLDRNSGPGTSGVPVPSQRVLGVPACLSPQDCRPNPCPAALGRLLGPCPWPKALLAPSLSAICLQTPGRQALFCVTACPSPQGYWTCSFHGRLHIRASPPLTLITVAPGPARPSEVWCLLCRLVLPAPPTQAALLSPASLAPRGQSSETPFAHQPRSRLPAACLAPLGRPAVARPTGQTRWADPLWPSSAVRWGQCSGSPGPLSPTMLRTPKTARASPRLGTASTWTPATCLPWEVASRTLQTFLRHGLSLLCSPPGRWASRAPPVPFERVLPLSPGVFPSPPTPSPLF